MNDVLRPMPEMWQQFSGTGEHKPNQITTYHVPMVIVSMITCRVMDEQRTTKVDGTRLVRPESCSCTQYSPPNMDRQVV